MKRHNLFRFGLIVVVQAAMADPVTGLTTFTAGTPARASEVNGNFTAVKTAVDNSHQRIVTLETQLAAIQAQLSNPQVQALLAIAPHVTLQTINGHPTVRISAANLQIVNGTNDTYVVNGTGNLLIGYDEARPDTGTPQCSVGYDAAAVAPVRTEAECLSANGTWAVNHKNGSHTLVVGSMHNYSSAGAFVAGWFNTVNFMRASVLGGALNHASAREATVSGGGGNRAAGIGASVSGGIGNSSLERYTSITGGSGNDALGLFASVSGGARNVALGESSSVSGGNTNRAEGTDSSISGGRANSARGNESSILGGASRILTPATSTIPAIP